MEISTLIQHDEVDNERLAELRFTIEPKFAEIQEADRNIQGMMRKLNLKRDLVNELKQSRTYNAKVKVTMQRLVERENLSLKARNSNFLDNAKGVVRSGLASPASRPQISTQGVGINSASPPQLPGNVDIVLLGQNRSYEIVSQENIGQPDETNLNLMSHAALGIDRHLAHQYQQKNPQVHVPARNEHLEVNPGGQIHGPGIYGPGIYRPGTPGAGMGNYGIENSGIGISGPWNNMRRPGNQTESQVKLPKIEMKGFNGDPKEWVQFWDLFERNVDKNQTLGDVNKMQYLKGLLGDTAVNVISHLLITEDNYRPAVHALKQRYGQPALLRNCHLTALK